MTRRTRRTALAIAVAIGWLGAPALAHAAPELSTTHRLDDRRYVAAGDRAYVVGFEDGRFPAQGWHVNGEMGGVWSQPLKFVDGVWFGIDGAWLPPATRFTSGWGYTRMRFPRMSGLRVSRTDFAPDGRRAVLFGLRLRNPGDRRTVQVQVDAHSELMGHYPWMWTTPSARDANLADTGDYDADARALVFRDRGQSRPSERPHDWAAMVGARRRPVSAVTGAGHRGPQGDAVCQDEGVPDEEKAFACDDGATGRGTGGQLRYRITVPARGERTLWIAVAGSDLGPEGARRQLERTLRNPQRRLEAKIARRRAAARWTRLSLPGDPQLVRGIDWGRQNLLDLTQRADRLRIRDVEEGKADPPPLGLVPRARWIGAGYPDYPWIFATDGEYTAFAAVALGQFGAIKAHARALRDVSVILNGNSGKVVHEVVADGSVYFGDLDDAGNTDETAKFPSMVALIWRWTGDRRFLDDLFPFARRNLEYIYGQLDEDGDGWPEGLGNVERTGMGEEKLDNAVYTMRGLSDLADMAGARGDMVTRRWARSRLGALREAFERVWWMPSFAQYADSLDDPGDVRVQQKHWIGVTPMEAELTPRRRAVPGIAARDHGIAALAAREGPCYSGTRPYNRGLFHTGCGGGPEGKGESDIFTLNTAIMAVGEGNYGRLGRRHQKRYTTANRETMLPRPDEQPGAMPEIAPSPPPRGRNVNRCTRCRSMVMQAWGNYGTVWPVVHQQLGVQPDLGRGRLAVVPQVPPSGPVGGRRIRLGSGAVDVTAARRGRRYLTVIDTRRAPVRRLTLGHTLPAGSAVRRVRLDGRRHAYRTRVTNRGLEVTVRTRPGVHVLTVRAR